MVGVAVDPNPLMIIPFGLLLATIALAPLFFLHWWEKHYPKVTFALGGITLAYYLFGIHDYHTVQHTAEEYVSFICLMGSLFVVSGGIHIKVKGEATPLANVMLLLFGAVIANVLGTTGASMLLIRPWIRMNKYRITAHHIVFFIFIVSNVGGCLTPIGDPPLFLGYLKGIPFWWVLENCWPMWLSGIGLLLGIFYVVDVINYRKAPKEVREELAEPPGEWHFEGAVNLFFLGMILVSVFITSPKFLREALMATAAVGSYFSTKGHIHEANHFNFEPIREVAILFIGIFATMMPALAWLQSSAGAMDGVTPGFFYWGTGLLSGVLDNAPTYLSFLSASVGVFVTPEVMEGVRALVADNGASLVTVTGPNAEVIKNAYAGLGQILKVTGSEVTDSQIELAVLLGNSDFNKYIIAISVAAVFFGANTYIGNGPNFMVKSIADQQKVHAPTFLGYVFKFTIPVMIPVVAVIWLIFFR
ncbi:MAG: hypothetical protein M2R45_01285 [Verrucomicrobia subdivision 3 bacterium]|nr:hypothetical protein [Limisphaerales bacterium]MCS1415151.1 hypothetical protein [Limisphaerales bacterium]